MEQNLCEIVIHTVTVLQCIDHVTVCEPLRLMMENPAALRVQLFPQGFYQVDDLSPIEYLCFLC